MNGSIYTIVIAVAALVLLRYIRNTRKPIKGKGLRLLLPLFAMAPGLMLILNPEIHAPIWMWTIAVVLGGGLSLPLIYTTGYEIRENGHIYAKPSLWFVAAFVGVLGIRFLLRNEVDLLDSETKAALFMAVAFSYIIPWRLASFIKYRRTLWSRSARV